MKEIIKRYLTSESVTEGHPDKVCDKIADTILDAYLAQDKNAHVACEVVATTNYVLVMGEVTANAKVDVERIVRETVAEIGYNDKALGFNASDLEVEIRLNHQSPDIAMGVGDDEGAGDQGMMFGFACRDTEELMPAPIMYSHKLTKRLAYLRKNNVVSFLRPDGKAQVTAEYENDVLKRIDNVVVSTQHDETISTEDLRKYVKEEVIKKVIPAHLLDENTKYFINPTGRFVIGGPTGDSGLTGRKIIVDTYGSACHNGGGAFSGKDPSKVDRSAAYACRYIAKNLVASGIIDKVEVGMSYAIGVAEPTSIMIETFGKDFKYNLSKSDVATMIRSIFYTKPKDIIEKLDLREPIYSKTTNYGHFGRSGFSWEKTDKVKEILNYIEKINKNL
ncbi:MAG: methionine adenosyltransferase [Bacilli bacterium]|nr:methionine adenosyltransferase [Bacilli bacterium]